jgi:glycosyltransferase involved in cell wall biosynthesis
MDGPRQEKSIGSATRDLGLLSIIVPLFNEQEVIQSCHDRLAKVLAELDCDSEVLYVNDGSNDGSLGALQTLRDGDLRVGIIDLSRNFGKEIAMSAGLDAARGDAVVILDADLQDPPELIPEFISLWESGYDVVYGQRTARLGEGLLKRLTASLFYRVMAHLGEVELPQNTGDFRLLSRRAVDGLTQLRERNRFMKGLFAWIGYPQIGVPYVREPRVAGKTKWNYWKLWTLALQGITSFSTAPLKVSTYLGFTVSIVALIFGAYIVGRTLLLGNPVPGYPSLMAVILFLGGVQLVAIGILGEYVARMFGETKGRPLYLVNAYIPARSPTRHGTRQNSPN